MFHSDVADFLMAYDKTRGKVPTEEYANCKFDVDSDVTEGVHRNLYSLLFKIHLSDDQYNVKLSKYNFEIVERNGKYGLLVDSSKKVTFFKTKFFSGTSVKYEYASFRDAGCVVQTVLEYFHMNGLHEDLTMEIFTPLEFDVFNQLKEMYKEETNRVWTRDQDRTRIIPSHEIRAHIEKREKRKKEDAMFPH